MRDRVSSFIRRLFEGSYSHFYWITPKLDAVRVDAESHVQYVYKNTVAFGINDDDIQEFGPYYAAYLSGALRVGISHDSKSVDITFYRGRPTLKSLKSMFKLFDKNYAQIYKYLFRIEIIHSLKRTDSGGIMTDKVTSIRFNDVDSVEHYLKSAASQLLNEGGAAGSMAHLYDDSSMTFGELKQIINDISTGKIEYTEKLDGQNIQLSFDPYKNRVLYARNRGQQLKLGATLEEFKKQYGKDHPIYAPFVDAMESFQSIVSTFGQKTQLAIFGDKKRRIFYNCEIIDARSSNVIKYDINSIVIHQTGHVVATTEDVYRMEDPKRVELLKSKLSSSKDGYIRVSAPKKLEISIPAVGKQAVQKISSLQKLYNLKDSDTVGDYVFKETMEQIEEALPNLAIETYETLAGKILGKDNTNIDRLIKSNEELLKNKDKAKQIYKNADKIYSNSIRSLELIINDFAMKVLQNVESEFVNDPTEEKKRLQKELDDTIEKLKNVKTEEGREFVRRQLEKIDRDMVSSVEGIVFSKGDKVFKITGVFAATNQILGALKFGKRGVDINESSSYAYYWKNCTDFECGNEVQDIVDVDDFNYPKELYYHNPDNIISKEEFLEYVPLSQWHPGTKTSKLFGYNFDRGIVFSYDPESDVHYFYIIKEVIGEKNETSSKTVSVVPGSFKPPHAAHWMMIQHYAAKSDVCYVVISDPQSEASVRKTPSGKSFTAQDVKRIFEIYAKDYGITNIEFVITTFGPVKWVYEYIGEVAEPNSTVILGVSTKQDDLARYSKVDKYAKPSVNVKIDPYEAVSAGSKPMSATDFRAAIDTGNAAEIKKFLPKSLSAISARKVLKILGV